MSFYGKEFDDAVWNLREAFPHERSIRIVIVPSTVLLDYHCEETFGDATSNRVRIIRGMSVSQAIDTLIHEFAHALQFRHNPRFRVFHSDLWGRYYARCYRAIE